MRKCEKLHISGCGNVMIGTHEMVLATEKRTVMDLSGHAQILFLQTAVERYRLTGDRVPIVVRKVIFARCR